MGYSYSDAAGRVVDSWVAVCREQTGQANAFALGRTRYFFEEDRVTVADGGIIGEVWLQTSQSRCRSVGRFKVGGDGVIIEAPAALRQWLFAQAQQAFDAAARDFRARPSATHYVALERAMLALQECEYAVGRAALPSE